MQVCVKPCCCSWVPRDSMKKVQMLLVPESHTKQKSLRHPREWSAYEGRWSLASAVTKCHCCDVMSKLWGCDQRGDLARWQGQSCLWKHSLKNKHERKSTERPQHGVITLPSLVSSVTQPDEAEGMQWKRRPLFVHYCRSKTFGT